MSQNMFCSGVELAKFLSSIGIIPYAFGVVRELSEKNVTYELHNGPNGVKVLAFNCKSEYTTRFVNNEFHLVQSKDHNVVDFIKTKVNPSFAINKLAVELFEHLMKNDMEEIEKKVYTMEELEKKDKKSPLLVTGWGLGGYLAILFTLWRQNKMNEEESKRPICITFGSPLIGDEALRRAISERPQWESCFLNVVAPKDHVASFVPSEGGYKPFGSFFFCTESGGHAAFEDHEAILEVLKAMALPRGANLEKHDYGEILSSIRRKKALYRGISGSGEFNLKPLTEGIRAQFKEIGVLDKISNGLMKNMESTQRRIIASKRHTYEPTKKLNDIKINMTYVEWYIKTRQLNGREGYYDCYKKPPRREENVGHQKIVEQHVELNNYWKKTVEEKDQNPQKQGAKMRKRWLYSGNNYRRMIEPLDIADYYKSGKTDYITNRSDHYKLLETWLNEDKKSMKPSAERPVKNKAPNLNDDSCFWARVEEALILLNKLKTNGSSSETEDQLEEFMDYMMGAINDYSVSPDIFLEGSSLMKWWGEYDAYKPDSSSKFAGYMKSKSYVSYQ